MEAKLVNVCVDDIQADEIWSFIVCTQSYFDKFHLHPGDIFEAIEFSESGWVMIWGRDCVYVVSDYPFGSEWVNAVRRHPPAIDAEPGAAPDAGRTMLACDS